MNRIIRTLAIGLLLSLVWSVNAATKPPRDAPVMADADNELAKSNLIVQVNPKYPSQAAREAIEGWVMLSYTISKNGAVEDITIVDASPEKVFDREARKALAKWRYKPSLEQGQPQAVPGVMVLLEFRLGD